MLLIHGIISSEMPTVSRQLVCLSATLILFQGRVNQPGKCVGNASHAPLVLINKATRLQASRGAKDSVSASLMHYTVTYNTRLGLKCSLFFSYRNIKKTVSRHNIAHLMQNLCRKKIVSLNGLLKKKMF